MPSNIDSISPGPSSTDSGEPVDTTGSPGPRPLVSSYTCIEAMSPRSSIISPDQAALRHAHDVVHAAVAHARGDYQRAGNHYNGSLLHPFTLTPLSNRRGRVELSAPSRLRGFQSARGRLTRS